MGYIGEVEAFTSTEKIMPAILFGIVFTDLVQYR
jgi:hypothetical protein